MELKDLDYIRKIVTKNLLGEASAEEVICLEEWLDASDENRELYKKISEPAFLSQAIGDDNNTLLREEWKKVEQKTTGATRRNLFIKVIRIAAAVVLPLAIGAVAWQLSLNSGTSSVGNLAENQIKAGSPKAIITFEDGRQAVLNTGDSTTFLTSGNTLMWNHRDTLNFAREEAVVGGFSRINTIQIPRGGEYIVRLEDGTIVHLNAESELQVPDHFGPGDRIVTLKGEAYFDVTPDPKRKFIVRTDKAAVTVLGTEFNVRAYGDEDEMATTLVKGKVDVSSGVSAQRMEPGYQARVNDAKEIVMESVNVYPFIAWKSSRIVFADTRLEEIMNELQRWYDCDVFYSNQEIREMRFTMDILKYQDITDILDLMEKVKKVTYTINGNQIFLNIK